MATDFDTFIRTGTTKPFTQDVLDQMQTKVERHPSSERLHQLLREMGELHDKKQADYGKDNDPFANIRASLNFGVPGWVGAMVRANDKVARIQAYAQKGTLKNEGVKDSFIDLAVYAIIAFVLFEEEVEGVQRTTAAAA